jgi:hypothetical protein
MLRPVIWLFPMTETPGKAPVDSETTVPEARTGRKEEQAFDVRGEIGAPGPGA